MILQAHPSSQPKRHLNSQLRFSDFCTAHRRVSLYFIVGSPSPSKLPLPMGGSGHLSTTWFLWPTQVLNPNSILIGSTVFAGLSTVTDRPCYLLLSLKHKDNLCNSTTKKLRCGLIMDVIQ